MSKNVRNVLIVLAVAALVALVPGGGRGANTALQALYMGLVGATAWISYVLYRQYRVELYSLGTRRRAILYAALAVGVLALVAGPRLKATGAGTLVWIALLVLAGYGVFAVWWSTRRY